MNTTEQMIRDYAHELWVRAGKPTDRKVEFRFAARAEFERREGTGAKKLGVLVRRSAEVRHESAADWGTRRRDPSF